MPFFMELTGLRIVVDTAHGAAYHIADGVFSELGAEVIAIGNEPDGVNINQKVGSTYPETIQQAVMQRFTEQNADQIEQMSASVECGEVPVSMALDTLLRE